MVVKSGGGNTRATNERRSSKKTSHLHHADQHPVTTRAATTAHETLKVLSENDAEREVSLSDYKLVAHIIHRAELNAQDRDVTHAKDPVNLTLHGVIQAYEQVLPQYNLIPEEDVHIYRILLKLSLDQAPSWWAKLQNECRNQGLQQWSQLVSEGIVEAYSASSGQNSKSNGIPEDGMPFCTTYNSPASLGKHMPGHTVSEYGLQCAVGPNPARHPQNGYVLHDISNLRDTHNPCAAVRSIDAEAFHDYKLVSWSFATWQHHAYILKSSRAAKEEALQNWRMAVAFWEIHLVQRSFRKLATITKAKLQAADKHLKAKSLLRALRAWAGHVQSVATAAEAMHVWRGDFQLVRCFKAWQRVAYDRKLQARNAKKALTHWMGCSMRSMFRAWRGHVQWVKDTMAAVCTAMGLQTRQAVLKEWLFAVNDLKRLAVCEQQLAAYNCARVMTENLQLWRARSKTGNKHRRLLAIAVGKLRNRMVAGAFACWSDYARYKRECKQKWAEVMFASEASLVAKCWKRWRAFMQYWQGKHAKRLLAMSFFGSRSLSMVFQAWCIRTARAKELAEAAEESYARCMQRVLEEALVSWLEYMDLVHEKRAQVLQFMGCVNASFVRQCLQEWKSLTDRTTSLLQIMEQLTRNTEHSLLRRTFSLWLDYWLTRQHEQDAAEQLARRNEDRLLMEVLQTWRFELNRKHKALDVMEVLLGNSLRRFFLSWREAVQQRRQWRMAMADGLGSMQLYRMQRPFQAWQQWAHRRALISRIAGSWLGDQKDALCRRMLQHWQQRVAAAVVKQDKLRIATERWFQGSARLAMTTWKSRAAHWARRKQHAAQAQQHAEQVLLRRATCAWRSVLHDVAEALRTAVGCWQMKSLQSRGVLLQHWLLVAEDLKCRAQRIEQAERHHMRQRQATSFYCWRIYTERKGLHAAKLLAALKHMLYTSVARAFNQWRFYAASQACLRQKALTIMSLLAGRKLEVSWQCWRQYTVHQKHKTAAEAHWCMRRLRKCLLVLQHRARLGRLFHSVLLGVGSKQAAEVLQDAWERWRCFAEESREHKGQLFRAVYHWVAGSLARALSTWRLFVAEQNHHRRMVALCVGHWQLAAAGRAFLTWRAVCQVVAENRRIVLAVCGWRMHRVMLWWRVLAVFSKRLKHCHGTLSATRGRRVLTICLRQWRVWVPQSRAKQVSSDKSRSRWLSAIMRHWHTRVQLQRRALRFWTSLGLIKAWNAWREGVVVVKARKAALHSAVRMWQKVALRAAWNSWMAYMWLQHYARQAVAMFANHRAAAAFHSWREGIVAKHHKANRVEAAARLWLNMLVSRAWRSWREFMEERQDLHSNLGGILARWQQRDLLTAFQQLRDNVHDSRCKRAVVKRWTNKVLVEALDAFAENVARMQALRRAVSLWSKAQLRGAFRAFTVNVELQHKKALAMEHARRQRLKACVHCWVAQACRLRAKNAAVAKAVQLWRGAAVRKVFDWWRHQAGLWGAKRLAMEKAVGFLRHLVVGKAFRAWEEAAARQAYLREAAGQVLRNWLNCTLAGAFNQWVEYAAGRAALREAASRVVQRWTNLGLSSAFQAWVAYTDTRFMKRQMHAVASAQYQHHLLANAFLGWHGTAWQDTRSRWVELFRLQFGIQPLFAHWHRWAIYQHHLREVATSITLHWAQNRLAAAFATWVEEAQLLAYKRTMVRRALALWSSRLLATAFVTWYQRATDRTRLRLAARRVMLITAHSTLERAWHSWLLYITGQRKHHVAGQLAAHRVLVKTFGEWRLLSHDQALQRHQLSTLQGRVLARMRNQSLWEAFSTWRQVATAMQRLKHLVLRVTVRQMNDTLQAWRVVARQLCVVGKLMHRRKRVKSIDVLLCWREEATELKQRRHAQAALEMFLESDTSGLSELFQYSLHRWQHCLLATALDAWVSSVVSLADFRDKSDAAWACLFRKLARKSLCGFERAVCKARKSASARGHASGRMLRLTFGKWNAWRVQRVRRQERGAHAEDFMRTRQLQHCTATWTAIATFVAKQRAALVAHISKAQKKHVHKVVYQWRALSWLYTTAEQRLTQRLRKLLSACIKCWRQVVLHQMAERSRHQVIIVQVSSKRQRAIATACMQQWKSWSGESAKHTRAVVWWALQLMKTAFYGWAVTTRDVQALVAFYGARATLNRCMLRWAVSVARAKKQRQAMLTAWQHFSQVVLWKALAGWLFVTAEARQVATAAAQLAELSCTVLVRSSLATWYKAKQAVLFHKTLTWYKCFRWWAWHTQRSLDLSARQQHLAAVAAANLLQDCFYEWLLEVQERKAREEAYELRQAAIREALRVGDQIYQDRRRALLVACLRAWRRWVALTVAVNEGIRVMMQRVLEDTFRTWRAYAHTQCTKRHAAGVLSVYYRQLNSIRRWRVGAKECAAVSKVQREQAEELHRGHLLGRSVQAWVLCMHKGRERQRALAAALAVVEVAALKELRWQAWSAWKQHCERRRKAQEQWQQAEEHCAHRLLREVLEAWRQYAAAMRSGKHLDDRSSLHSVGSLMHHLASGVRSTEDSEYHPAHGASPRSSQPGSPQGGQTRRHMSPLLMLRGSSMQLPSSSVPSQHSRRSSNSDAGPSGRHHSSGSSELSSPKSPRGHQHPKPPSGSSSRPSSPRLPSPAPARAPSRSWASQSTDAPLGSLATQRSGLRWSAAGSIRSILEESGVRQHGADEGAPSGPAWMQRHSSPGLAGGAAGSVAGSIRTVLAEAAGKARAGLQRESSGGGAGLFRQSLSGMAAGSSGLFRQSSSGVPSGLQRVSSAAGLAQGGEGGRQEGGGARSSGSFQGFQVGPGTPSSAGKASVRRSLPLQIPSYDSEDASQDFNPAEWQKSPSIPPSTRPQRKGRSSADE